MALKEEFDWKLSIKTNILMLQIMGLWPRGVKRYKPDFYKFHSTTLTVFIASSQNFFQIVKIFFVYQDLEALTATIFITCTAVLVSVKMYFFTRNGKLLKELADMLSSDLFKPVNDKQVHQVRPILQFWNFFYVVYWIMVCATVCFWSIVPFLNQSVKEKELPFPAWYPYDSKMSPLYELTYFYQVFTIWYLSLAGINMDTLIAALMMYVGIQCDVLSDNVRNLKTLSDKVGARNVNEVIIRCVKQHREIISFAQKCTQFLNMIALGQFFTSTMVITLTMFQLSLVDPLSKESFSHLFYVSAITSQIFLYSWFGNEVEIKNTQTSNSSPIDDELSIPVFQDTTFNSKS
ncbi:hypothetical protein Zmor_007611 [Zophobas morio]|uniref:Odorant receptor n=1 Tax=Zophobas morio TaxID=2755281 RepID=A0AA38IUE7_9CUCU|nr:hypothetical protein Zmor_007611 [Zophobas morio]